MKLSLKFLIAVFCVSLVLLTIAALPPGVTGRLIYQYPNNANPPTTFLILLDPGNGVYQQSSLGQIATVIGGSSTNYVNSVSNSLYLYVTGSFVLNLNGFGTNESFWGPTTFLGTNQYGKLEIFDYTGTYVAGFDTNKGGFWGFGNLNGFTNLPNSGLQNSTIAFTDGAGIGGSGSPTTLGGTYTVSAITAAPQFAGIKLTGLSSAPVMQLNTNVIASATNTLDWTKTKYTFVSPTAMQTTGFVNFPTTNDGDILVHLVNNSGSSNWFYTWPMSIMMDGARGGVWVTNAQHRFIWFIYDPGTGTTNEIDAPNF